MRRQPKAIVFLNECDDRSRLLIYPNPWSSKNPWGVSSCNRKWKKAVHLNSWECSFVSNMNRDQVNLTLHIIYLRSKIRNMNKRTRTYIVCKKLSSRCSFKWCTEPFSYISNIVLTQSCTKFCSISFQTPSTIIIFIKHAEHFFSSFVSVQINFFNIWNRRECSSLSQIFLKS